MLLRDRVLAMHPGSSRNTVKRWLTAGRVQVNDRIVRRGDVAVAESDRVRLTGTPPAAFPSTLLRLVHEDEEILVVDKPPGLLTIATERERERTAYRALARYVAGQRRPARLFVVHRLDRETSGLLVFAKSSEAKRFLQEQFARRTVERVYVALVEGRLRETSGILRDRLTEDENLRVRPTRDRGVGREAITTYRMLEQRRGGALLQHAVGRDGLPAHANPIVG